jgi:hypothetical protein
MHVLSLFIYPVKSCRGIAVEAAEVVERGFASDRRLMVVDEHGNFSTQREIPKLALVTTELFDGVLRLRGPGVAPLELPAVLSAGPRVPVSVWGYRGEAIEHVAAGRWLKAVIERPVRLVYMPDDVQRPVNPKYARPSDIVSFADAYPLLLVSQSSLDELNRRLDTPVGAERFRPNIVIDGAPPHAEDDWQRVVVGTVPLRFTKPCDRCAVVCVDPATGARGREPLRTLATYRKVGEKVFFGVNLVHEALGTIRVGDSVTVSGSAPGAFA